MQIIKEEFVADAEKLISVTLDLMTSVNMEVITFGLNNKKTISL